MSKQFIVFPGWNYEGLGDPEHSCDTLDEAKIFINKNKRITVDYWHVYNTDTLELDYKLD